MPDQVIHTFIPFVAKRAGNQRLIEGPITADVTDVDGQGMSPEWLKSALPQWMSFGNIREQHQVHRPVGKAQTLNLSDIAEPRILAKISDDQCWQKIEDGVYSGFSLGIRNARFVHDGRHPKGTVVGGDIIEVSVVDHPAVRKAAFTIVNKVAGGWQDMQSGLVVQDQTQAERIRQYEASLQKAAGPSPVQGGDASSIIQQAQALRAARRETTPTPMPAYYDEDGNPVSLDLLKAAFAKAEDEHKGDKKEDGSEEPEANGKDEAEESEEDDFTCPRCHKDARHCECYKSTNKAAADFSAKIGTPRPIGKGSPLPKGTGSSVTGAGAMHDDSGRNAPLDGADAKVRLDYYIKSVESLVTRMKDALDSPNSADFNPNNPTSHTAGQPAGDPNHEMGRTPPAAWDWHGQHTGNGSGMLHKGAVTEEEAYRIAADVSQVAIQNFFADTNLSKGASPDETQANFAALVTRIATDVARNVAFQSYDQLEERVAKVEKMPMPAKGIAALPPQLQATTRTYDQLSPQERLGVDAELTKTVGALHDQDQTALLADLLSRNWASPQPYAPTPQ